MSSDCGDSDESEDEPLLHRKISADRIDQHKAANKATNPSTRLRAGATSGRKRAKTAGGDSALIVLAVDDQAIKKEHSPSLSLFPEQSEHHPSPRTLVVTPEAEQVPNFGTETIATRKRSSSAPLVTPPTITKRLRLTDENLEHLVRSCSELVRGRR